MANVLDYLKWRGDLSLDENPFNEVDAMVLARISYIPFDGIVAANFKERILLKEAAEVFLNRKDSTEKILWHTDLEFLSLLSTSKRFGNMELSGYVNQIDEELEKQFCAVTVKMKNQTYYVSYRGTDSTLVGWKEDFNMTFMTPIPSQQSAYEYFTTAAEMLPGEFFLGGHSKGGNLAVYAAAMCGCNNQKRIIEVYNFDGPGFEHNFHSQEGYISVSDKIRTYIPQSSIVGMLLDHEEEYMIVKSSRAGIMQHDLYSWEIMGKAFIKQDELAKESRILDISLKEWVSGMNYEQRQQLVDAIFMIFRDTGASTMEELMSQWYKNIGSVIASLKSMDNKDKKNMMRTFQSLIKIFRKNMA